MALPEAKLTIRDGALGLAPANANNVLAIIGTASSGPSNVPQAFGDIQSLKDTYGGGPLVEAAAYILSVAGGPVVALRSGASVAGANGAVTKVGTGTSVATVAGTPTDTLLAKLLIVTGSAAVTNGEGVFRYSLDNGISYSEDISLPASGAYLLPGTGVTITFGTGTLVAGDTYSWSSSGPGYNTADLNNALQALLDDAATTWFAVLLAGVPADDTAAGAAFGAVDTKMASAAANTFRYAYAIMNAQDDTRANVKTAWATRASATARVDVAYGFEYLTSPLSGIAYKRPASWGDAARAAAVLPSEDLGRVRSGPLAGVHSLIHDEFKNSEMDAARFTTLRTIVGRQGYYVTNGRIFAPAGSDFAFVQNRRVMDIGATVARAGLLSYLNEAIRVASDTGRVLEADARAIEADLEGQMRAALTQPGYASDLSVQVDRTVNVLSTNKLVVRFRIVPLGYAKYIEGDIGFLNPALQPV